MVTTWLVFKRLKLAQFALAMPVFSQVQWKCVQIIMQRFCRNDPLGKRRCCDVERRNNVVYPVGNNARGHVINNNVTTVVRGFISACHDSRVSHVVIAVHLVP